MSWKLKIGFIVIDLWWHDIYCELCGSDECIHCNDVEEIIDKLDTPEVTKVNFPDWQHIPKELIQKEVGKYIDRIGMG